MNNKKALGVLFIGLISLLPRTVLAIDLDYYVYDGFDTVLAAFQRLALIYSDNGYLGLYAAVAVLAIIVGGVMMIAKKGSMAVWAVPILVGTAVYAALIVPKGTIHLYDPVRNEYQAVGGIPDIIVAAAGITNLLERGIVDVVGTASAYPYANEAGGISFELMFRATGEFNDIDDVYLTRSVGQYFSDCGVIALLSSGSKADMNTLKRNTTDILTEMAKFKNPALYTTWYDSTNKGGVTMTCTAAYNNKIQPALVVATRFDSTIRNVCAKAGFNVSRLTQITQCKTQLGALNDKIGLAGYDAVHYVRNVYLAQTIHNAMLHENPDLAQRYFSNRQLVTQGVGMAMTANEWLPTIRAVIISIALGMLPFISLFIVTPIAGKAIGIMLGIMAWITLWGIADAAIHQAAMDSAQLALERIKDYKLGLDSIYLMPEASIKALSIFGKTRTMGITMATFLAMSLFKFGGYAWSGMAANWSGTVENTGGSAADRTHTAEGRSQTFDQLNQAPGSEAMNYDQGFNGMSTASFQQSSQGVESALAHTSAAMSRGSSMKDHNQQLSATEAGARTGSSDSVEQIVGSRGGDVNDPRQLQDAATDLAKIESLKDHVGTQAHYGTVKDLGDGDFLKGAQIVSGIQANQNVSETATVGRAVQDIKSNYMSITGEEMSDTAAHEVYARTNMAEQLAKIEATGGNPNSLIQTLNNEHQATMAETIARADYAQSQGMSYADFAAGSAAYQAYQQYGQIQALDTVSPQQIVNASRYDAIKGGMEAQTLSELSERFGGDEKLIGMMKDKDIKQEVSQALVASRTADLLGKDLLSSEVSRAGEGVSFNISQADAGTFAARLQDMDLFNDRQASNFVANGGGAVTLSFDATSGQVSNVATHSGSDVNFNRSVTDDRSSTANTTDSKMTGTEYNDNYMQTMLSNEHLMAQEMRKLLGDQGEEYMQTILRTSASHVEQYGNINVAREDAYKFGISGQAGVGAFPNGLNWMGSLLGSAEGTTGETESTNFNGIRGIEEANLASATAKAHAIATDYADSHGQGYMSELYMEKFGEVAAQQYANSHEKIVAHMRSEGREEGVRTDVGEEHTVKEQQKSGKQDPIMKSPNSLSAL